MRKSLDRFHQRLYEKAREEALSYPAYKAKTILRYAEDYKASLPKTFENTSLKKLLSAIEKEKLFIYGDFHTLKQSQKGFVRILKALNDRKKGAPFIICMEMFKYSEQKILDSYLSGACSEATFLEKINYHKEWGFPWEHYRPIVEFARARKVKIIGINTRGGGKDSLVKRDGFAAKLLRQLKEENPDKMLACLIGEYHLGDSSLTYDLKKFDLEPIRIFTNVDAYYFQKPLDITKHTEYLYLKNNDYCILNSPPWIKWQSYCLWEEMRSSMEEQESFDDDDEDEYLYPDETIDIDAQIENLTKNLLKFIPVPKKKLEPIRFTVVTHPDQITFQRLKNKYRIKQPSINQAILRLTMSGFHFEESSNIVFITDITHNNLAKIAGQLIHNMFRLYPLTKLTPSQLFCYRCLSFAAGKVAAKILNPKMKSYDMDHYKSLVASQKYKKLVGAAKSKRDAIRKMIRFNETMHNKRNFKSRLSVYSRQDKYLNYGVSLLLGEMMGSLLYKSVMNQSLMSEQLASLFLSVKDPQKIEGNFLDFYENVFLKRKK